MNFAHEKRMSNTKACELCQGIAAVYCSADEAFVCWDCDAKVHGANFIVARHSRFTLCHKCNLPGITMTAQGSSLLCSGCSTSGDSNDSLTPDGEDSEHSSTESVVSNKRSKRQRRTRSPVSVISASNRHIRRRMKEFPLFKDGSVEKLRGVFRSWSLQLGMTTNIADRVIPMALHFLRQVLKSGDDQKVDARATLAACLWAAAKAECFALSPASVERCTGVPMVLLLATEAKFRPAFTRIEIAHSFST